MRGFLIFLALACPVVLWSPAFWTLVDMEWGASAVTYHEHDGTVRQALLGPKAPWPAWALRPDGSNLRVKSWFAASAGVGSTGIGDLTFHGVPHAIATAFAEKLRADGWEVEATLMRAPLPQFPPRMLEACKLVARKDNRELHASIEISPNPGTGALYWSDGPSPPGWRQMSYMDSGAC